MKAKIHESFRIRIMIYTFISMISAVVSDFLIAICCIRFKWFISDYHAVSVENNFRAVQNFSKADTTMGHMLSQNNLFYKLFGVKIGWQLIVILFFVTVFVFLCVFLVLTRNMAHYIESIHFGLQRMSEGDFEYTIVIKQKNEFSYIAEGINRMADTVVKMQARALDAETTKNELITNVAHDLRSPLTSILGYIDIINTRDDLTDEKRKEYMMIAYEKAQKLNRMINELFDFTKVNYTKKALKTEPIDLVKLLAQEIDEMYPVFEDNQLTAYFHSDLACCLILADGEQLMRVFDNLLGNAVKYGKDGKIIEIKIAEKNKKACINVINYGSVIPEESVPHLFDKFYRVDTARQSDNGGAGLGLAIAKSIVEAHNGTISVRSSFDGTVFEVILPIYDKNEATL